MQDHIYHLFRTQVDEIEHELDDKELNPISYYIDEIKKTNEVDTVSQAIYVETFINMEIYDHLTNKQYDIKELHGDNLSAAMKYLHSEHTLLEDSEITKFQKQILAFRLMLLSIRYLRMFIDIKHDLTSAYFNELNSLQKYIQTFLDLINCAISKHIYFSNLIEHRRNNGQNQQAELLRQILMIQIDNVIISFQNRPILKDRETIYSTYRDLFVIKVDNNSDGTHHKTIDPTIMILSHLSDIVPKIYDSITSN